MVLSLAENSARTFQKHGRVTPLNIMLNVFHLHTKDNLDSNVSARIATEHFHGTSMSALQFPTAGKKN